MKLDTKKYIFQWGEQQSALGSEFWARGYGTYCGKKQKTDYLVIAKRNYLNTFISKAALQKWTKISERFLEQKYQESYFHQVAKVSRHYKRLINKIQSSDVSSLENEDLYKMIERLFWILRDIAMLFALSSSKEGFLRVNEELNKCFARKNITYLLPVVTMPTSLNIIYQEQRDLAKLGDKKKVTESDLDEHAKQHAWLFFNCYDRKVARHYLRGRLSEDFDKDKAMRVRAKLKKRQQVIFRGLCDRRIELLAHFIQDVATARFEMKNMWGGAEFRTLSLLQEIARRTDIDIKTMMQSYFLQDFKKALLEEKVLAKKDIASRKKSYVLWKRGSILHYKWRGKEADLIIKEFEPRNEKKKNKIVGESASPGRVQGKCRLIETRDVGQVVRDLKRFRPGNILVSHQTQPNMMPLIFRAGAIVADQGGIASHAAIISRECGIPCIVGTKVALKMIKDGQRVIVDANRGEIILQ